MEVYAWPGHTDDDDDIIIAKEGWVSCHSANNYNKILLHCKKYGRPGYKAILEI